MSRMAYKCTKYVNTEKYPKMQCTIDALKTVPKIGPLIGSVAEVAC